MTTTNRVIVQGTHPGGEVWSWSLAIAQSWAGGYRGTNDPDELEQLATAIAALNGNKCIPTYLLGLWAPATAISGVRVEFWDEAGKITGAGEKVYTSSVAGTGSGGMPPQTAVVVTLNYGARYGRSGRGRYYMPLTASGVIDSTLQLPVATTDSICTASKQWIQAVQAEFNTIAGAGSANWWPGVLSRKLLTFRELGTLAVGSVVDTQRRRRDGLVERRSILTY